MSNVRRQTRMNFRDPNSRRWPSPLSRRMSRKPGSIVRGFQSRAGYPRLTGRLRVRGIYCGWGQTSRCERPAPETPGSPAAPREPIRIKDLSAPDEAPYELPPRASGSPAGTTRQGRRECPRRSKLAASPDHYWIGATTFPTIWQMPLVTEMISNALNWMKGNLPGPTRKRIG